MRKNLSASRMQAETVSFQRKHEDPLFVVVEPFNEWVVETNRMKNPSLQLEGVHYEEDLEPFIEGKLFSVNSGHATSAYTGAHYGFD